MTNYQVNLEDLTPVNKLQFEPLDRKYIAVHIVSTALVYVLFAALALLLMLTEIPWICVVAESLIVVTAIINLTFLPKAFNFKGYAFRENDLSYRSGLIFPKVITIPYIRIQQISVNQNPLSKMFSLYSIDVVNGAQRLEYLRIPGLTEARALQIKNLITEKTGNFHD